VVDMVVTDLAVFTIDKHGKHGKDGMALIELADGVTLDEVEDRSRILGGVEERELIGVGRP
jgi:3-oxoacid CoA-transferase subunit B